MREKSQKDVWDFANKLFWTLALVVAVITVLGMVFSPVSLYLMFAAEERGIGMQAVDAEPHHFPVFVFHRRWRRWRWGF